MFFGNNMHGGCGGCGGGHVDKGGNDCCWLILILLLCGNCGFSFGGDDNNCCSLILLILLLSCCGCGCGSKGY